MTQDDPAPTVIRDRDTDAVLYEAVPDPDWPERERLRRVLERAVKDGADLAGADLRGADLMGAGLGRAKLRDANLRDADLMGAKLRSADLMGAGLGRAKLRGADLGGANLMGATLPAASLRGANLRGADLRGAALECVDLRDADLKGADLWGATLACAIGPRGAMLIGPDPILQIAHVDPARGSLVASCDDDGVWIQHGRFAGTLEAFRAASAETHVGDQAHHDRVTDALMAVIEAWAAEQRARHEALEQASDNQSPT